MWVCIIVYNIPRQYSIESWAPWKRRCQHWYLLVCLLSTHPLKYALFVTASGTVQTIIYPLIVFCSEVLKYSCAAICRLLPPSLATHAHRVSRPGFRERAASFPPRYHPPPQTEQTYLVDVPEKNVGWDRHCLCSLQVLSALTDTCLHVCSI